ncbi:MAG: hypothetical protein HYY01_04200 [Chloroflexi bacterium]|nr:hypothetical protein [Chloroflexota bacterium]
MATWDEVRLEIERRTREARGEGQQDVVRREKIQRVEGVTKRPLIVYATDFLDQAKVGVVGLSGVSIGLDDKKAFIQATSDVPHGPLDILLHSPGGSPTAAESIVHLLRSSYKPIRFIIPDIAKSAATMLALSGDEILMDARAELGPIDPQLILSREGRVIVAPAQAVIDQFERAHAELVANPNRVIAWMPILREYGPALLEECHKAIALAKQLASDWLAGYMFANDPEGARKANVVADYLGDHNNFKSHGRRVGLEQLEQLGVGLKAYDLQRFDPTLHEALMDLYWSIDITFNNTHAFKIVEHRSGSAYIQSARPQIVQLRPPQSPTQPTPQPDRPVVPQGRAERRRQKFGR